MRRQSLLGFIIVNVVVTILVAAGVIFAYTRIAPPPTPLQLPPVVVYITTTPQTMQSQIIVVTATLQGAAANPNAAPSPGIAGDTAVAQANTPQDSGTMSATDNATSDAASTNAATPASPGSLPTDAATGCPLYTVKKGDIPGGIAYNFGISLADLYNANHLKVNPLLQIGQTLIIPVNGCGLSTGTPTPTATSVSSSTPLPTSTLAPTAVPAVQTSVSILQVIRPGDITAEGIELQNNSKTDTVDLTGWTVSDGQGDTFTFPAYRLFPNGNVTI